MRNAWVFLGLIAVIGALIVYFFMSSTNRGPHSEVYFAWEFTDAGVNDEGAPRTIITLNLPGNTYTVATETGTCGRNDGRFWKYQPGEISSVVCWWGSAGSEIGIFQEGNQTIVKRAPLDEYSAQDPTLRTGVKTLFAL